MKTKYQKDVQLNGLEWGRVHVKVARYISLGDLNQVIEDVEKEWSGDVETFCKELAHRLKCKVKFVPDHNQGYSFSYKYTPATKVG